MRALPDGRVFFIDHNSRRTTWDDPRAAPMTGAAFAAPTPEYTREFTRKAEAFRAQLRMTPGEIRIPVRRSNLFEDSYLAVSKLAPADLNKRFRIQLDGEAGLDYGGPSRMYFFEISHAMFSPYYGLFEYAAGSSYTLQINKASQAATESHLSYFRFIGRMMALAVFNSKLLDAYFTRAFYKQLLGQAPTLADMQSVDSELHSSLVWMLENDIEDVIYHNFSEQVESFGAVQTVDLKPGGREIEVTNENKDEYVRLVVDWRLARCVAEQMGALLAGIGDVFDPALLRVFDHAELEYLLSGIAKIDVDDWEANTVYRQPFNASHMIVRWFWQAVRSLSHEQRARLLTFVTGTSKVPLGGFAELYGASGKLPFTIDNLTGGRERLPIAHSCFNRLDLSPAYPSYKVLRAKLLIAIEECTSFELQ